MSPRLGLDVTTILQKSAEIADGEGFEKLTLGSLAAKLNIRTPSLYNHVDGLNGLKQQLAIYALERLHTALVQSVIGRSGDEAIRSLSLAYAQFARMHPGLYEATSRFTDPDDPILLQAQHAIVQLIVQLFEKIGLKGEAAVHMVRAFRSSLHGFVSLEQTGGFRMALDLDKSFSVMVDTLIEGIYSTLNN